MKILLIMPDPQMHKVHLGSFVRSLREAPLTLTTLAALTEGSPDVDYQLVDENVERVPLDAAPDLVGISVLTGTAPRAYAIADHFRRRGIPVVLGGVHVTLRPEEAAAFADAIVVGPAERAWPELVGDLRAGRLQRRYDGATAGPRSPEDSVLPGIPAPRFELQRSSRYMFPYAVMATRGCAHVCDFCTVPAAWPRYQRRPVADVVRDVRRIPSRRFVLNDVSPFDDLEYAKELLRALAPLGKKWGGLATTRIARDPELMELLPRSGCRYLLFGFESVNQSGLRSIGKGFNHSDDYGSLVAQLHEAHISVQGCFVFGFDHDTRDVFAATLSRVEEVGIDIPRYSIYTPYPGTRLFERLEAEGRILSYRWDDYDTMHVVHRPLQMSPVELYEGFRWAYRETFRLRRIFRRSLAGGRLFPISLVGNLTYRLFSRRLDRGRGPGVPVEHLYLGSRSASERPQMEVRASCAGSGLPAKAAHAATPFMTP
jgi:radical SAM superfamily enzyme YgiQ (UPF0313 family)